LATTRRFSFFPPAPNAHEVKAKARWFFAAAAEDVAGSRRPGDNR